MIRFRHSGNFDSTERFLARAKHRNYMAILHKHAAQGLSALRGATPKDSGVTADSWDYEIRTTRSGFTISWTNSNLVEGIPVVILLQYGHATRSGSFVQGEDFINPAMKPTFDTIAENLWKEVTSL